jgi:hypothetical protein
MAPIYLGLVLLSAAAIAFEVTLTRLFSVTQWYHFAFLAVSVALLGYGASGTALSLVPSWSRPPVARRASTAATVFAVGVIAAYLCLNYLPFDSYRIAWERIQLLYLVLYYLALAVPFFCAGLVIALLLAAHPQRAARLYAASLLGSAAGGLLPAAFLPWLGEGIVLLIASFGLFAALAFRFRISFTRALLLAGGCLLLLLAWNLPPIFRLQLSPYKGLSQVLRFPDAEVVLREWNAFSRVDRVASSAIRSAPGLSLSYPGQLPKEDGLFVDGGDMSPVLGPRDPNGFTDYLPVALPYQLRPAARALLLEPRGGLDVQVALSQGATSLVAVEANPLVVQAAEEAYDSERVDVRMEDGRSYAHRSSETFDVVHLALGDAYRPLTSGAYGLGERYDLTVEAFEDYLARLEPGGLLVVQRWLQLPPSETLRVGVAAVEALRRAGVEDPAAQLVVLRGLQTGLVLVKNGAFEPYELERIRSFSRQQGLDLVALPGMEEAEANQYNVLAEPLYFRAFQQLLTDPDVLFSEHPYNVQPTTDDRPFFFHFFKWTQSRAVLEQLGKTWQPWGGSGYFVLVALLGVALLASVALIVLPLGFAKRGAIEMKGPKAKVLIYFGLLGIGFLFVEIPLMQRFILFLGQPIYAFTAVLAALLFFSGLGSLAAVKLSPRSTLPLLVGVILLYPLGLPLLFEAMLGAPLIVRFLVTCLSLAPLGFLMGVPFPGGLEWLRIRAPGLIPWAWAINGCASVLASILAAMIALSTGFSWVLAAGAMAYGLAWFALR